MHAFTLMHISWWDMPAEELILLPAYVGSLRPAHARDVPVFLPRTSPEVGIVHELCHIVKCIFSDTVPAFNLCAC